MITLLLHLLRLLPFVCGGHRQLALENLALHQQLAVYKRTAARPKLRTTDRLLWVWLARVWAGWRQPGRQAHRAADDGQVVPIPEVGGLHHRDVRRAA